ncbi:putative methyltransferase NSUN7 [Pygocentrus nattereri]|uniref:putative methyltransferase NSUN7 n=1 Tax=Pygocentrus nattereri TaxID=42514 RepID=UPI001890EEC5|nr:putative methyltransferase NSUN7 [Pygocentrus nattereri]
MAHVEKPLAHRVIKYAPTAHTHAEDGVHGDYSNAKQNELWAYELAFSALKFQELLEDMLINSCFHPSQQMPDDLMSLVVVMLYDLQDRKFQPREPVIGEGEGFIEEVRRVENSLFSFRTKLAASLARCRIKQNLLSINDILPKSVREKRQRKHKLPLCAWVNILKTSTEEVCETLRAAGFIQVDPQSHLEGKAFCKDLHCPDVLLFSQQAQQQLDETLLLTDQVLIIQAKVCSLAVSAVRPLLAKNTDILMVGSFSAQTVAHVAVLASACDVRVHICGLPADPAHRKGLQSTFSTIGCKNVLFLSDEFAELNEWDSRIQKVRVILLLPPCTVSGLSNPVEHILHEDGDRELLQDLSKGTISDTKLDSLVSKQMQDLSHALTFPKVHAVVYCTCSVFAEENELLVKRALENAIVRPKLRPFRIVSTGWREEAEEKFFRLEESDSTDACFICVLRRDQEPAEPETVQDILVRAAAKGLLGNLIAPQPSDQVKQKKRQREKGAAAPLPPLYPLPPAIADTTGLLNDLSVPDRVYEQLPMATAVHIRTGSMYFTNLTGDESGDSCRSFTIPNEVSTTLTQASTALTQLSAEPDNSATNEAVSKQTKGHRRQSKSRRTKQTQGRQNKSKSRGRATKAHRSQQSRKRRLTHRQARVRAQTLAPLATTDHPLTPAPPPGKRPAALKSWSSLKEPQKLHNRRKPQQETLQEVLGPQPAAMDLNGVIKLQQEVARSMRVVLPPISASGCTVLSSNLSSHLLQSSTGSSSTGSYLSSGLSLPTSRSESRDSVRSGVTAWR